MPPEHRLSPLATLPCVAGPLPANGAKRVLGPFGFDTSLYQGSPNDRRNRDGVSESAAPQRQNRLGCADFSKDQYS
jgi:hypothetical protein